MNILQQIGNLLAKGTVRIKEGDKEEERLFIEVLGEYILGFLPGIHWDKPKVQEGLKTLASKLPDSPEVAKLKKELEDLKREVGELSKRSHSHQPGSKPGQVKQGGN